MKPFEHKPWETQCRDGRTVYAHEWMHLPVIDVDGNAYLKRFKGAELAEHFHFVGKMRAVWELSEHLANEDYSTQLDHLRHQEIVLHRFMTTPDAKEKDYQ